YGVHIAEGARAGIRVSDRVDPRSCRLEQLPDGARRGSSLDIPREHPDSHAPYPRRSPPDLVTRCVWLRAPALPGTGLPVHAVPERDDAAIHGDADSAIRAVP